MKPHGMKEVTSTCPACAAGIKSARDTYAYRRIYCCEVHQELWDTADAKAREREARKTGAEVGA